MAELTNAPCGCPISLFEHADGIDRPITLAGIASVRVQPAIWCGSAHGWVTLPPADLAALVLTKLVGIPTEPGNLAPLLAATPGDGDRAKLFGLLQHAVGKGRVNDIWYEAGAVERGLLAGGSRS